MNHIPHTVLFAFLLIYHTTGLPQNQERPVRFVIANFQVDGANSDLSRRLRSEFENQLFDVVDQCIEQMEFIPDAQGEAIDYLEGISDRFRTEYGLTTEKIPIPKRGNYIILARFEPDNSGTYLQIGVFARSGQNITYVGNGIAESNVAINALYTTDIRREFIRKAMVDALNRDRLIRWISSENSNSSSLGGCFGTPSRPIGGSSSEAGNKGRPGVNTFRLAESSENDLVHLPPDCENKKRGVVRIINNTEKDGAVYFGWSRGTLVTVRAGETQYLHQAQGGIQYGLFKFNEEGNRVKFASGQINVLPCRITEIVLNRID